MAVSCRRLGQRLQLTPDRKNRIKMNRTIQVQCPAYVAVEPVSPVLPTHLDNPILEPS